MAMLWGILADLLCYNVPLFNPSPTVMATVQFCLALHFSRPLGLPQGFP